MAEELRGVFRGKFYLSISGRRVTLGNGWDAKAPLLRLEPVAWLREVGNDTALILHSDDRQIVLDAFMALQRGMFSGEYIIRRLGVSEVFPVENGEWQDDSNVFTGSGVGEEMVSSVAERSRFELAVEDTMMVFEDFTESWDSLPVPPDFFRASSEPWCVEPPKMSPICRARSTPGKRLGIRCASCPIEEFKKTVGPLGGKVARALVGSPAGSYRAGDTLLIMAARTSTWRGRLPGSTKSVSVNPEGVEVIWP